MKNNLKNTKSLVTAALLAAFTCIATMIIQIPTPTLGYIHPGDSLVILSGVLLGPALGALCAGIGSMFADLLSGYVLYAIPTLIIKALSAAIAGVIFQKMTLHLKQKPYIIFLSAGILAECNTVFGYFINSVIQPMFLAGRFDADALSAGLTNGLTSILPNLLQAFTGIVIGLALFPILSKIPDINGWMYKKKQHEEN